MKSDTPTIHDNTLLGYNVDSRFRKITVQTERPESEGRVDVIFSEVTGYLFEHDPFGTIFYGIEEVDPNLLMKNNWDLIQDGCRESGWFGAWAQSLERATAHFAANSIKGYELSSSIGMSGWVLAKSMEFKTGSVLEVGTAIPQLPSGDIETTATFFSESLGFDIVAKYPEQKFLIVRRERAEIHFWQAASDSEAKQIGRASSCYIRVASISSLYEEFKSRKVSFRYELTKQPWGMNEMQIDDPYGNAIKFGEPTK